MSGLPIDLASNPSLPQLAGVLVTGTGSFTPMGGEPGSTEGTTDAAPFTKDFRSGIGSYTINAQASDVAGNIDYRPLGVESSVGKDYATGGISPSIGKYHKAWRPQEDSSRCGMMAVRIIAAA